MTVQTLTAEQMETVKKYISGIEDHAEHEKSEIYGIDYIDVLEDGLAQDNISYSDEQKEEMLDQIRKGLEEIFGYHNVFYGSSELHIPVDGQIKTYHFQLAIRITEFSKLNERNSTIIEYEGQELRTIEDPYQEEAGLYQAIALNQSDDKFTITWEVNHPDFENLTDESEACDWDNPIKVARNLSQD
ncbi:hypothetical protein [Priestia megaterium]|uniref:hypothetical protein n=1 Tax=Priestia megaterium TaxID=1404 RepID=UPI002E204188|nr:hypothetical protein [Priestia megaterium]MED4102179.1 hypothetical protein [Priestia megaterium]MED4142606.1 hypothetical protein [Priestia megaterium]